MDQAQLQLALEQELAHGRTAVDFVRLAPAPTTDIGFADARELVVVEEEMGSVSSFEEHELSVV